MAELVTQVPTHAQDDDFAVEVRPLNNQSMSLSVLIAGSRLLKTQA